MWRETESERGVLFIFVCNTHQIVISSKDATRGYMYNNNCAVRSGSRIRVASIGILTPTPHTPAREGRSRAHPHTLSKYRHTPSTDHLPPPLVRRGQPQRTRDGAGAAADSAGSAAACALASQLGGSGLGGT